MALAKDRMPHESHMGVVQACIFYGDVSGGLPAPPSSDLSSPGAGLYGVTEGHNSEKAGVGIGKNFAISPSSSLSSPSSTNSSGIVYVSGPICNQPDEGNAVISFKAGHGNFLPSGNSSLLSFDQNEGISRNSYPTIPHQHQYYSTVDPDLHFTKCGPNSYPDPRLLENFNCVQIASSYSSTVKENQHEAEPFGWHPEATTSNVDSKEDFGSHLQQVRRHKRPRMGDNTQGSKRQCNVTRKNNSKSKSTPSKDPQSIAAKKRRERISDRLKLLQDLVPNGSKVDLVTMLEKAISYVKFLQLQVKVLATDEFWPAHGGKAPDLCQVKEAIDAILASQKDRNSSSK